MKQFYLYAILLLTIGACGQAPKSTAEQPVGTSTDTSQYQVALLVMPGVYNTELVAPMDIFQHTKFREGIKSMRVFTVAKQGCLKDL